MTFPRKGSVTMGQLKSLLNSDPIFNNLTDTEKTAFINVASQKVCSFRNQEKKEDYAADTIAAITYPEA